MDSQIVNAVDKHLVTVICTTYNHVDYIEMALESFVRQKTKFSFQVLVGDDCSNDGTTDIVLRYATSYPQKIKAVVRAENLGAGRNSEDLYKKVATKYVAICEGDDYWIDDYKLQKQVDFLENNPKYSICFHPVTILDMESGFQPSIFPDSACRFNKRSLEIGDLLKRNFIQTNSVMYRWIFTPQDPDLKQYITDDLQPGDYLMHLLHAESGKIRYLDETMSVYRRHPKGIWSGAGIDDHWFMKWGLPYLNFCNLLQERYRISRHKEMSATSLKVVISALKNKNIELLERLYNFYPKLFYEALAKMENYTFASKYEKYLINILKVMIFKYKFLIKIAWGLRRARYWRRMIELEKILKSLI